MLPPKVRGKLKRPIEVVIAFGCNIGNCERQIKTALFFVKQEVYVKGVSPLYRSKPYGVKDQPDFYNGLLYGFTRLSPYGLLNFLKEIEKKVGRKERCRWCEREIDLDIIYYGKLLINFQDLIIPHPDRFNRDFVLIPADWISPTLKDPLLLKTPKGLIKRFLKGI
ncbi:MAG TPA: 2-amino-4-hydroxy-6-hydroxymethyldihydropteridine diphosphokinase [Aquifex aeolicus]|nr:2-amino-4-hydroxy-6-hydroxymethyldihydropteridine diphosphokinase [Aquifex aeolicus]